MTVKKKKILLCIIMMLAIFIAAGCGSSDTDSSQNEMNPYEVYTLISNRVDELSSIEAQLTTNIFINNSVESLELSMVSDIKQIGNAIIGADVEMITSTRYLDKTLTVSSYYTDGYYYTDYNGEKIKYQFDNEEMMKENHLALPELSEESIKESTLEIEEDNGFVLTLMVDPSKLKEPAEEIVGYFVDESTEFFNYSDLTMVIKADENGNIQSCDYLISMNVTENGVTTEYTIDAYIEYLSINEKIEIAFPDFSGYKEVFGR